MKSTTKKHANNYNSWDASKVRWGMIKEPVRNWPWGIRHLICFLFGHAWTWWAVWSEESIGFWLILSSPEVWKDRFSNYKFNYKKAWRTCKRCGKNQLPPETLRSL